MNNNQWFDEHIKEQVGNYAPDVHPRIWENIAAKKDKRKPVGFWFTLFNSRGILLLSGLLLAAGTGTWLLLRTNPGPADQNITQTNIPGKKVPAGNNGSQSPGSNDQTPGENTNSTAVTPGNNSIVNTENGNYPNAVSPGHNILASGTTLKTNIIASSPVSDDQNNPEKKYNRPGTTNSKSGNEITGVPGESDPNNDFFPSQGSLMGRLLLGIQKINAERRSNDDLEKRMRLFGFLPDCPHFEKDAAGNKKYIEFYAGPDMALRSISDTGNSAYLQKRKESTRISSAYSAGMRYTRVFGNSMSLRAGVNYSQINEKFTYIQGGLIQVTYIIDANGDTTGSYITTGTRYKTTHNKYRSVDIPLMLGYELGNGKLHANINVGPVVNVYSWQKGEVLDTSYLPVTITTGKGSSPYQFKTNAGFGVMGAVSLYYKLNEKLHVMAEPYFRYNFTQLNKENLTIKQKYNTVGLKLGLRIDLK